MGRRQARRGRLFVWALGAGGVLASSIACSSDSETALPDENPMTPTDPDPTDPTSCEERPQDGTRLKAIGWQGEDGSWQSTGHWQDVELGTACSFALATDDVVRCLPSGGATATAGPVYVDAACTQEAVPDPRNECQRERDGALAYATASEPTDCGERVRIRRVGASLGRSSEAFLRLMDGSCVSYMLPTLEDGTELDLVELFDEVAPDNFVAAEEEQSGERLQRIRLVASDGAVEPAAGRAFDADLDTTCYPGLATDGVERCLPREWSAFAYGDASCSGQPLWPRLVSLCPGNAILDAQTDYAVVREPSANGCGAGPVRVYALGEPSEQSLPAQTFTGTPEYCQLRPEAVSWIYLPVRDELPPETFVGTTIEEAECSPERTSGSRLQVKVNTAGEGYRFWSYFVDAVTGVRCDFQTAADGVLRCLPFNFHYANLYADAACTRRAAAYSSCDKQAAEADPDVDLEHAISEVTLTSPSSRCATYGTQLFELVGPELPVAYELDADGACVERSRGDEPFQEFYREVGPELAPEGFVAASDVP